MNFPDSQGFQNLKYTNSNGKSPLQTTFVRSAEFLKIDPNELIVEVEEDEY